MVLTELTHDQPRNPTAGARSETADAFTTLVAMDGAAGATAMLRAFYLEMPPVTRAYSTACVMTTLAVQLDVVSPFQLYFNPLLIWRGWQLWRLVRISGAFGFAQ